MTGFLNYSSCATRLGVESNISPLVSYVNCSDKSYPQSYPHNSSTIATVYGVIHRLIHRKDIEGHRLRPHAKIKISIPPAKGIGMPSTVLRPRWTRVKLHHISGAIEAALPRREQNDFFVWH